MGKQRIAHLLEQLKDNQQRELENAAAIYTVAQVAINELRAQGTEDASSSTPLLPAAPGFLTQTDLLERYGSFNGCRKAAKDQGIKFSRTPSWQQLIAAFSYVETFQHLIRDYVRAHPTAELHGVSFELKLDE